MCGHNWIGVIVIILIVVIGGYFLLKGRYETPAPTQELTPAPLEIKPIPPATQTVITVQDQETVEDQVIIQEVSFKDAGYMVIHLSQDGKPGSVIGNSALFASGTYTNVGVEVSELQEGENSLFAMVHIDDGDGVYEFPGDDVPAKEGDTIVVKPLTVTKSAGVVMEVREIMVSGTEFSFNPASITVSAGEQLKITFRNDGNVIHNFKITELGVGTNTIASGKTDSIEFTVSASGTYTFFCSVPGHQVKGMEGTLTVQ